MSHPQKQPVTPQPPASGAKPAAGPSPGVAAPPAIAQPSAALPAAPAIPLTPELQAAYQSLYNQYEAAIESTADVGVLEALNASQLDVGNILTKNAEYQLNANTALYGALQTQIKSTNTDLKTLQAQMTAIANGINTFGGILAAINKVLTLLPGI